MSVLHLPRCLTRTTVVGVALIATVAGWAPAVGAQPATTLALDPPEVEISLRPHENIGLLPIVSPPADGVPTVRPMDHQWGGTSRLLLPDDFDGAAMEVALELSPSIGAVPTRTYSTTAVAPADQLALTDLGPGPFTGVTQYEVTLPAYDAANPPFGRLVFGGIETTAGAGFTMIDPLAYQLQFTGSGGLLQYHSPQVVASAQEGCPVSAATPCSQAPVTAGSTLTLTVPAASRLHTLGLGNLVTSAFALQALDGNGAPTGAAPIRLDDYSVSADGTSVSGTLPASTPAGAYRLTAVIGAEVVIYSTDTMKRVAIDRFDLQVEAAANSGLRSNTGWGEDVEDSGTSPLVPLGAGMVVVAGAGAVAALRMRRRTDSAA